MIEHSKYYGVMIYSGQAGETPHKGAFYIPKKGDILSRIGQAAGINWKLINGHPWNMTNLVEYRADSSSCKSEKIPVVKRPPKVVNLKAFISLCPIKGLLTTYQMIWIPDDNNAFPEDLAKEKPTPEAPAPTKKVTILKKFKTLTSTIPKSAYDQQRELINDGAGSAETVPASPTYLPVAKSSMGGWLAAGGVVLAGVLAWVLTGKKKKR